MRTAMPDLNTNSIHGADENGTEVLCTATEHAQSHARRKRLEFVHIPKTGGTVIESIAANHNISWSICHFGYPESIIRISLNLTHCPPGSLKYLWPKEPKHNHCPWWHVPPQYFELYDPAINPYAGADLFVVVRNPYDRVISEYYYSSKYISKREETWINDLSNLNTYVKSRLSRLSSFMRRGDISRKIVSCERNVRHKQPSRTIFFSHDCFYVYVSIHFHRCFVYSSLVAPAVANRVVILL